MQTTVITLCFFSTLAQSIAKNLNAPIYLPHIETFADGELCVDIDISKITTKNVIIVHSLCPPIHDNFMKLALCVQALKAHGISDITAMIPYLGYSRQMLDTNDAPGGAHMIATLLQATGISRIVTCVLHDKELLHAFTIPAHEVSLEDAISDHIKKTFPAPASLCCIAPDHGAQTRVHNIAQELGCGTAFYHKKRIAPDTPKLLDCTWHCTSETALIIDDIIDTASTILAVCEDMPNHGILQTYAYGVHPVFSRDACARIEKSRLKKLFICNTIEGTTCALKKIEVIDVGAYIAKVLQKL